MFFDSAALATALFPSKPIINPENKNVLRGTICIPMIGTIPLEKEKRL
jgi:hypothetical protein